MSTSFLRREQSEWKDEQMKADELGFKIVKPTLLLDKKRVLKNIEKMSSKAKKAGVRFRPHFKTHQSAEIGNWFRDYGVKAITVSSLDMATYFADNGWLDITVAFIVNLLEIDKINKLAGEIKLSLLVDSEEIVSALNSKLQHPAGMWIKIDTGYHRTGILWDDFEAIRSLAQKIKDSSELDFRGLLTHAGHSYKASSVEEIQAIHDETVIRLSAVKDYLETSGIEACQISVGDTPTCSVADDFDGVDEIRPGNFVFYDLMQEKLGSCTEDASLENQTFGPASKKAPVVSLTQEHGIIQVDDKFFNETEITHLLLVFPVHSCLTADLYKEYKTLEGKVIARL